MNKEEIEKEVIKAVAELFEIEESDISLSSHLYSDLDLDSIDAVDLVVHLQALTKNKIDPDTFKQVKTISDVVNAVDALINA